jgi:hypothetical protein
MMCGVADEGSAALFVCGGGGTDLAPAPWHLPHRRARWHRRADDANAPVCAAGATTPEPDPGVGGREEGLDLPGGQIGVKLLCVEGESVLEDGRIGWICPEGRSA